MMSKVLIFDIESTNLAANFGYIICISYKWLGENKVHTISISESSTFKDDPTNDRELVQRFKKIYEQADMVVAHYGQRFDKTFINTRLMIHNLGSLPRTKLFDTWRIAKDHLRLNSNRLASLISALNIRYKKTELNGSTWIKAMSGDKKSIIYVIEHCIKDVLALEQVYLKLSPLVRENIHSMFHKCNKKYLQKYGIRVCDKKVYQRYLCKKCGGWIKGEVIK